MFLVIVYFLWRLEVYKIVSVPIIYRYNRWKKLNRLVSTQHRTAWAIFYYSLTLICRVFYLSCVQYLNNTVVKLNSKIYLINYVIKGRQYSMIIKPKRGPTPVLQIINEDQEDITEKVLPYMGPKYDWYHDELDFNVYFKSKKLTFNLSNGNICTGTNSSEIIVK